MEKPEQFETVYAGIRTACMIVATFALVVIAIAVVKTQIEITQFLDGAAWEAPWLNVINRGPVQ